MYILLYISGLVLALSELTINTHRPQGVNYCWHCHVLNRDRPNPILLVLAVAETVPETKDTHSAEPGAKSLALVLADTVAETKTQYLLL